MFPTYLNIFKVVVKSITDHRTSLNFQASTKITKRANWTLISPTGTHCVQMHIFCWYICAPASLPSLSADDARDMCAPTWMRTCVTRRCGARRCAAFGDAAHRSPARRYDTRRVAGVRGDSLDCVRCTKPRRKGVPRGAFACRGAGLSKASARSTLTRHAARM